jgi:hypothetical protein
MAAINYYYLNIFLKNTYKNLGQVEAVKDKSSIKGLLDLTAFTINQTQTPPQPSQFNTRNITVTGLTQSRLNEIKSYNPQVPYKVNINGVTKVDPNYIEYTIDGIDYKTFLSNNLTIYKVTKPTDELTISRLIGNNDSVFVDIKKTLNAMIIERSNLSIYDYFNKMNACEELDDILDIF